METSSGTSQVASGTQAQFAPTHWTLVLTAANQQLPGATEALEQLCRSYWFPLYAFLRRKGRSPHDSQDLVQGFFAHLLAKESRLQSVHPNKGRFRNFLLACLKHYVANVDARNFASIRNPGQPIFSIDEQLAEERYSLEPAELIDPARIFERRWAFTVVEQTLARLKEACAAEGKANLFEALSPLLTGEAERGSHAQIAARLGMSEGAVRVAASRLRADYRDLLVKEIARTVENPDEVDAELRELFALFSR